MTVIVGVRYDTGAILAADCMVHGSDTIDGPVIRTEQRRKLYGLEVPSDSDMGLLYHASAGLVEEDVDQIVKKVCSRNIADKFIYALSGMSSVDNILANVLSSCLIERSKGEEGVEYLFLPVYKNGLCDLIEVNYGKVSLNQSVCLGAGREIVGDFVREAVKRKGEALDQEGALGIVRSAMNQCLTGVPDRYRGYTIVDASFEGGIVGARFSEDLEASLVPNEIAWEEVL